MVVAIFHNTFSPFFFQHYHIWSFSTYLNILKSIHFNKLKLSGYVGYDSRILNIQGKNSSLFTFYVNNNKQKSKQFVCLFILTIQNKIIKFPLCWWYLRHLCSFWENVVVLHCTSKLPCRF